MEGESAFLINDARRSGSLWKAVRYVTLAAGLLAVAFMGTAGVRNQHIIWSARLAQAPEGDLISNILDISLADVLETSCRRVMEAKQKQFKALVLVALEKQDCKLDTYTVLVDAIKTTGMDNVTCQPKAPSAKVAYRTFERLVEAKCAERLVVAPAQNKSEDLLGRSRAAKSWPCPPRR